MTLSLRTAAALLAATAAVACSPRSAAPPAASSEARAATPSPSAEDAGDAELAKAIALFERRTAADPRDALSATTLAELRLRRAVEASDAAEFPPAERAARTALERQPGHPQAVAALARAVAGQGRADEGRRLVAEALSEERRNVRLLEAAFDLTFDGGDERVARIYCDRLLAVNEEPGTLSRMARIAARDGDTVRALTLWRRAASSAAELGGTAAEIAGYRRDAGLALAAAGRPADAAAEFDAALVANPYDVPARRGRAALAAGGAR